jgi:DNA-binding transcriptional MocR family regulator
LRKAVLEERLGSSGKVPSTRDLTISLALSGNTVNDAYARHASKRQVKDITQRGSSPTKPAAGRRWPLGDLGIRGARAHPGIRLPYSTNGSSCLRWA